MQGERLLLCRWGVWFGSRLSGCGVGLHILIGAGVGSVRLRIC